MRAANIIIQQITKTACTLKKGKLTIPAEKYEEIKSFLATVVFENQAALAMHAKLEHLPPLPIASKEDIEVTDALIQFCYKMPEIKLSNKDKQSPHGKIVVEQISKEGKISEFIKLWRTNFLTAMEPKYLPLGWRVEHTVERSFGVHSKFNKKEEGEDN